MGEKGGKTNPPFPKSHGLPPPFLLRRCPSACMSDLPGSSCHADLFSHLCTGMCVCTVADSLSETKDKTTPPLPPSHSRMMSVPRPPTAFGYRDIAVDACVFGFLSFFVCMPGRSMSGEGGRGWLSPSHQNQVRSDSRRWAAGLESSWGLHFWTRRLGLLRGGGCGWNGPEALGLIPRSVPGTASHLLTSRSCL